MNREEAARDIDNTACCFSNKRFRDAMHMAADALRGPQPDPITGLVPCGCGGKAEFYEPDDEFYMVGVECSQCYVSTCATCDKEHATHDWNRAMGWKGGAE